MRLPSPIVAWLSNRMIARYGMRDPDFIIGTREDAYLLRWFVIPRNRVFNIYLHQFLRSDDDRALHDHPWINLSILLTNYYVEHTILAGGVNERRTYKAGDLKFRRARAAHRIELVNGACWTLFVTGPNLRNWGFHCPNGWRRWQDFVKRGNSGEIGPGCGDSIVHHQNERVS